MKKVLKAEAVLIPNMNNIILLLIVPTLINHHQRSLRDHPEHTHSESIQRTLREHSEK